MKGDSNYSKGAYSGMGRRNRGAGSYFTWKEGRLLTEGEKIPFYVERVEEIYYRIRGGESEALIQRKKSAVSSYRVAAPASQENLHSERSLSPRGGESAIGALWKYQKVLT